MMVLGNYDIMEHLASFLNNQDLGSWYDTCQTVKSGLDGLSLWRMRAQEHAKILRKNDNILKEKTFDCQSEESSHFRELCHIFQADIESQAAHIRGRWSGYGPPFPEKWSGNGPPLPEILTAATLAHHGKLGSVEEMWLEDVDLASVPAE